VRENSNNSSTETTLTGQVRRRKLLKASGLAAVAGIGSLSGCSGGGDSNDGSESTTGGDGSDSSTSSTSGESGSGSEITIVTNETTEGARSWFNSVTQAFEDQTGTPVSVEFTSLTPEERITQLIQTGNTPELATLDMRLASEFVLNDQLADIGDVLSTYEDQYNGTIPDGYQLQINEGNWYLPIWVNPSQMWYWKDVYAENGYEDMMGAISWDEFENVVSDIHSDQTTGTIIASASTGQSSFTYWGFLLSNGGQVLQRNSGEVQIALDQGEMKQKAVETAEYLNRLHQYSPEASNYNWGENINSFTSRISASAMYPPRIKVAAIQNTEQPGSNIKPHYPVENGSERMISFPGGMSLFRNADNVEGARDFLNFIAEENYLTSLLTSVAPVHNWPAISEITRSEEYQSTSFIDDNFTSAELDIIASSFENGITFGGETETFNRYGAPLFGTNELGTLLYNVNTQGKDPTQAVEDTADRLRSQLQDLK
jgi:ABC-type glycerol-3-phosphate transport system substrate-binding protein